MKQNDLLLLILDCPIDVNDYDDHFSNYITSLVATAREFSGRNNLTTTKLLLKHGANVDRICRMSKSKQYSYLS